MTSFRESPYQLHIAKDNTIRQIVPKEDEEQMALVEWLRLKRIKHTAIPNSTYIPSGNPTQDRKKMAILMKNKRMGLCKGLPDLLCILERSDKKHVLFVEMKRRNGVPSDVSVEQRDWIETINQCEGVQAIVCYGAEQAITAIRDIIGDAWTGQCDAWMGQGDVF